MSFVNNLIQSLVPKDRRFYPVFEAHALAVKEAADSYYDLLRSADPAGRRKLAEQVAAAEQRGDVHIHTVMTELTATFLTPFDREDIHRLVTALDGILDELDGGAQRVILYEVGQFPPLLLELAQDVQVCAAASFSAVCMLKNLRQPKEMAAKIKAIQDHKTRADKTFMHGLASLYNGDYEVTTALKLREIFYATDKALAYFQELSFALEAILIKTT